MSLRVLPPSVLGSRAYSSYRARDIDLNVQAFQGPFRNLDPNILDERRSGVLAPQ